MIDGEVYLHDLLDASQALTPQTDFDLWVAPDIDVDTLKSIPALTWNLGSDDEGLNGPGAWWFVFNATVFGDGMDQAKAVMRYVDGLVMAWFEDPDPTVLTVDGDRIVVSQGDRLSYPTRQASAEIQGRLVVQYSASYSLLLRS